MNEYDKKVRIFTIGYAGKNAEKFFSRLLQAEVKKIIDVRLYNTSRLAGFTRKADIEYFLKTIVGVEYNHTPIFAPTKELLSGFKNRSIDWSQYETQFNRIIAQRQIEKHVEPQDLNMACLLCAEANPQNCHRRLVAEYLAQYLPNISIHHL